MNHDDSAPAADAADPDRSRQRHRITAEAARRVTGCSDVRRAVFRAARRVAGEWVPTDELPERAEIHHVRVSDAAGSGCCGSTGTIDGKPCHHDTSRIAWAKLLARFGGLARHSTGMCICMPV
jgi:hypothetical protein